MKLLFSTMEGAARRVALLCVVLIGCALEPGDGGGTTLPRASASPARVGACGLPTPGGSVVLDVGHHREVATVIRAGDRVLSQDDARWVLWDAATGAALASGPSAVGLRRSLDLAGSMVLTPSELGVDLRSARDGAVRARIPMPPDRPGVRQLAEDGSYAYVGDVRSLRVYDLAGHLRFEHPGDYRNAQVHAGPTRLRVALDATATVETLSLSGEGTTSPAYEGRFHNWFLDGEHFATDDPAGIRVYTAAGALLGLLAYPDGGFNPLFRPSMVGFGPYLAIQPANGKGVIHTYRIDDRALVDRREGTLVVGSRLATPTLTVAGAGGATRLVSFELDPTTRALVAREGPSVPSLARYGGDARGGWVVGSPGGELSVLPPLASDAPTSLGCGRIVALAGARDRLAMVTGDRKVRVFDVQGGALSLVHTLTPFRAASEAEIALADEGRYLVARGALRDDRAGDRTVWIYDLTAKADSAEIHAPTILHFENTQVAIATTAHADLLAVNACDGPRGRMRCVVHVVRASGQAHFRTPEYTTVAGTPLFALSPDGGHVAVSTEPIGATVDPSAAARAIPTTLVYDATQQRRATLDGARAATWLDVDRLLVRFDSTVRIVDAKGDTLADPFGRVAVGSGRFASDHPAYFYGFGYVYRADDASIAFSPAPYLNLPGLRDRQTEMSERMSGYALVGDRVALGADQQVHLLPFQR